MESNSQPLEDRPIPAQIKHLRWRIGAQPYSLRTLKDFRSLARAFQPDLVQAGPIQRSAFIVALAGFHPLVTMSWGYDLLVDVKKGSLWHWITRFTLKRSDALVADCDTIRNLAEKYGMDKDRIVTFPWGANVQKFTPAEVKWQTKIRERLGWGPENFVLLSTRSWSQIYGVEDLARAFVRVSHKHPEVRLLMLGNGPLAPQIRNTLLRSGVSDLVFMPGQVSQDHLPDYYRAADLYISTSHSDGTSISMLEAFSSGAPALLTDIPGNREWITSPGEVGWLYRDGDVEALAHGINHAIDNRDQLNPMGRAARSLAVTRGNWESNFPHLFEAFEIARN